MSGVQTKPESVRSRYVVTLSAQIFRMFLAVITAAIVPRSLGPADYGNYNFLLSTSAAIRGFLDNGTQQAFFTFSSQEGASGSLTKLYAAVIGGQFLIALLLIGAAVVSGHTDWLWHGQRPDQILLVTSFDWALFLALSLQQLGDSKGQTTHLQIIGAVVALFTLCGLLVLHFTGSLTFHMFVSVNLTGSLLSCAALGRRLIVRNRAHFWDGAIEIERYARRWWNFTKPLILLQYYLPVVTYLGLYLIQRWYGSKEQGYYALALQWSAFAMVFTTSGVYIFWREIAHHSAIQDLQYTARVYSQFSRRFFFLALVLACGLSGGSSLLVALVAGDRFGPAAPVVAIMAFYPISQTINQLTSVSMKAMERTAAYARWSIILSVPDLVLAYFLLAPADAPVPGLHLGAIGMAVKTALYGLATSQVYDWVNCRYLGLGFLRGMRDRLIAVVVLGLLGYLSLSVSARWLQHLGVPDLATLIIASVLYAIAVLLTVLLWPAGAGFERTQIYQSLRALRAGRIGAN